MHIRISDGQDRVIAECDVDKNHVHRDLILFLSSLWLAQALAVYAASA